MNKKAYIEGILICCGKFLAGIGGIILSVGSVVISGRKIKEYYGKIKSSGA